MEKLANAITNYYVSKKIIAEDKREVYSYGFKLIFADIINFTIVIALGIILKRTLESIVFLLSLCILRQFSGGFHAKTFWLCRLSMIITYLCVICLTDIVTHMDCKIVCVLLLNVVCIMFVYIYAPIENPNKPLSDKQRHKNKTKSIITSIILSIISAICVVENMKCGVTISISLLAVITLMIIAVVAKKGGENNV